VATDDRYEVLFFTASTGTATVTVGTATAFQQGERVDIIRDGAAVLQISPGAGVTLAGAGTAGTAVSFTIDSQYDAATVICKASNEYRVIGVNYGGLNASDNGDTRSGGSRTRPYPRCSRLRPA